jgi:hypothetical protein
MSNQQTEAEKLVSELRELAARTETMGADQRRILDILHDAISRAAAILERPMVKCRQCDATMTENECGQSLSTITLHARAQTGIAGTAQQFEWARSQMPLCAACVSDMIQENLGLPNRRKSDVAK